MSSKRKISHRAMLDDLLRSGKLNAGQKAAFKKLHEGFVSGAVTELSGNDGLWVEHVYYEHMARASGRQPLKSKHLDGFPGLSMKSRAELLAKQPRTVAEALRIEGVGRKTTRRLLELGLLEDPEGVQ